MKKTITPVIFILSFLISISQSAAQNIESTNFRQEKEQYSRSSIPELDSAQELQEAYIKPVSPLVTMNADRASDIELNNWKLLQ
jgi:hypothetical protein